MAPHANFLPIEILRRRALICISCFCLFGGGNASLDAQDYWIRLDRPTTRNLARLCFLDSLTGWAVGDSGTILATKDGCQTWIEQDSRLTDKIVDIFMLNENRGWALAQRQTFGSRGTFILNTHNGGKLWENDMVPDSERYYYSLFFFDSLRGWMAGTSGALMGTTDGGAAWFPANIDTFTNPGWPLYRVEFVTPQLGFAGGGRYDISGVVWRTTDGGEIWEPMSVAPEPLLDFYFSDSLHGLAVGGDFDFGAGISRTTDAGRTWESEYLFNFGQARAVSFRNKREGWSPLGFAGGFMYTLDSGRTWAAGIPGDHTPLYDVVFTDEKTGYMIGDTGIVLKYNLYIQDVPVNQRWNIVAVPASVVDARKDLLFSTAVSDAFAFGPAGYETAETLRVGAGYWLKFPADETVSFEGRQIMAGSFEVRPGWNMIGSLSGPVPAASISSVPEGIAVSPYYGYYSGYMAADTLMPGKGYWIKVAASGTLMLEVPASP